MYMYFFDAVMDTQNPSADQLNGTDISFIFYDIQLDTSLPGTASASFSFDTKRTILSG